MFYDVRLIYTVGNTGRLQNTRNNVTQDKDTHTHRITRGEVMWEQLRTVGRN